MQSFSLGKLRLATGASTPVALRKEVSEVDDVKALLGGLYRKKRDEEL